MVYPYKTPLKTPLFLCYLAMPSKALKASLTMATKEAADRWLSSWSHRQSPKVTDLDAVL